MQPRMRSGLFRRRLPSFGEQPMKSDIFTPGEIDAPTRFHPTPSEEASEYFGPEMMWDREWVTPKPVRGIPGDKLATYAGEGNEAFRKMAKENIFKRLNIIPTPSRDPEIVDFGRVGEFGFGGFGQDNIPETGDWGYLINALSSGTTGFFEAETRRLEAQSTAKTTTPKIIPSSTSSSIIPLLIIGGVAFLMFRKKSYKK